MTGEEGVPRTERMLARVERAYLAALRVALLLLATGLIVWALWLAVAGLWGWSRNPASVVEQPVEVTASEVAAVPADSVDDAAAPGDPLREERRWYRGFVDRYHQLYTTRYERFRQASDSRLSRDAFDSRFVGTGRRIEALGRGDGNFADDKATLDRLLTTMTAVAREPATMQTLNRYRTATRTRVSRNVGATRSERYCSYFSSYDYSCLLYSSRTVPYTRTVSEMRLPQGVVEPPVLFGRQQQRFLDLLEQRTIEGRATAAVERGRLEASNAAGAARLRLALSVVAGFLLLMFLFLLIAIERHQRRIAAEPVI